MNAITSIIVPLDGSPFAEKALPWALDLAAKYNSRVVLVRVAPRPEMGSLSQAQDLDDQLDALQGHCQAYLHQVQQRLAAEGHRVEVEYLLGNASQCLVERSEADCGLIVMTSHGRDGLSRWLIGSVAEKVSRHAHCPVLLVR